MRSSRCLRSFVSTGSSRSRTDALLRSQDERCLVATVILANTVEPPPSPSIMCCRDRRGGTTAGRTSWLAVAAATFVRGTVSPARPASISPGLQARRDVTPGYTRRLVIRSIPIGARTWKSPDPKSGLLADLRWFVVGFRSGYLLKRHVGDPSCGEHRPDDNGGDDDQSNPEGQQLSCHIAVDDGVRLVAVQ